MKPVILASNSPRRRELLRQIGIDFTIDPADVDERALQGEPAGAYALRVAEDKARAAARRARDGIVIAADTIVVLDGEILGKPEEPAAAARMLTKLSGRMHLVLTGVFILDASSGRTGSFIEQTKVWFAALSPETIRSYVSSGEPLDKAGAYGIQGKGALLVDRIEGCYFNVVGMPLARLARILASFGVRTGNGSLSSSHE